MGITPVLKHVARISTEFVAGTILSIVGYLGLAFLFTNFDFNSGRTPALLAICIGAPIGCAGGVSLVSNLFFRSSGLNLPGLLLAIILYCGGVILLIEGVLSDWPTPLALILPTAISVFGYEMGFVIRRAVIGNRMER